MKHGDVSASLPRGSDPAAFTAAEAIELLAARRASGPAAAAAHSPEEGGLKMTVTVLGGGLAGSEAAWALAERGVAVTLVEMRPVVRTAAHQTDRLAELVCSNTFKSVELVNAHGLLKAELRVLGSMLLECADAARVPGGTALAVDREVFAAAVRSAHHWPIRNITRRARRGRRAARAGHRRHRAAHVGAARRGDRRAARDDRARVLRRHRADRVRRTPSIGTRLYARSRATGRARATTT